MRSVPALMSEAAVRTNTRPVCAMGGGTSATDTSPVL